MKENTASSSTSTCGLTSVRELEENDVVCVECKVERHTHRISKFEKGKGKGKKKAKVEGKVANFVALKISVLEGCSLEEVESESSGE